MNFTDVFVDGCLFQECYAAKKGGGMHQFDGQVTVTDSVFYQNLAGGDNIMAGEHELVRVQGCGQKGRRGRTSLSEKVI